MFQSRLSAVVLLLLPLLCAVPARAASAHAEMGRPPIRNWTMRDYGAHPQNWVAQQDAEGRLYFGNRDGVLMYDGEAWTVLPMPGVFVRGLDFAADGCLYAGAVDELGYFDRTPLGEWGPYVSLLDHLPPDERTMGDIRATHVMPDGVYFVAAKRLFRWRDGAFHVWRFDGEWNTFYYRVGDRLFLHRMHAPLQVVSGNDIVTACDLPEVTAARLAGVMPWEGDSLLLAWPDGRMAILEDNRLTPWAESSREWLGRERIRAAERLNDELVALILDQSGVVLLDRAGDIVQRIDVTEGLYNPVVRDVMRDTEGGLWFALNHGVAHVDALTGFTLFDRENGLGRNTVRAVTRYDGRLYAATAEGLFRLRPAQGERMAQFEFVAGSESDAFALYAHPSGILIGTRDGVYLHPDEGGARIRLTEGSCLELTPRPGDPDSLWLSGAGTVYPLNYDDGAWTLGDGLPGPVTEARTVVELEDGSLWASTPTRGLLHWRAPLARPAEPAEVIFESAGLPEGHGWMRIVRWHGMLVASSVRGLFRWNPAARQFEPLAVAGAGPDDGSRNVYGGDPEHLWSFFGADRNRSRIVRINSAGTPETLPQAIVQEMGDIATLWREELDGREILWVGGSYGLARIDLTDEFRLPESYATIIGGIERTHDPRPGDDGLMWRYGEADFSVRFAAATYRSGPNLRFQSWLEGYEPEWGAWTSNTSREFTNLSAGDYILRVRARDADQRIGREAVMRFAVLPPWWQTGWAFAGGAAAVVLLIYGIVRWRVRHAERDRERLQHLVAERTCQLVESQRDLVQAKDAADAANRAKSAFLASMSHELRTPLNSVLGYAQILQRSTEVGPGARRAVDTIQRSGDHLLHLINEVLDLAKVEAGRIVLQEGSLALGSFAQSITDLFAARLAERDIVFRGPAPSALTAVVVRADEPRLRQVLLNLLGNAFKFTERGEISWDIASAGSDRWRIEVRDSGVGIPATDQTRIFEPFYQSTAQPELARQGTGLGLSISAHLVQLMGGRLQVESEPGRGSRFWFEVQLPAMKSEPAAATEQHASRQRLIVGYRGRRRRLLVVDDERNNRAVLDEMLAPLGFIIETAESAGSARDAVERQAPDAVLLDLRMPGDDGFTLARQWRENGALLGAKVLALSASVLPEQREEAIAAGCDAFLGKPFREEQLLRVLGSLLEIEWLHSGDDQQTATIVELTRPVEPVVRWEAGLLQRLLQLAERGDALRLGQELAAVACRSAAWAAIVAPWQKLALGYQMEALSRSVQEALEEAAAAERG